MNVTGLILAAGFGTRLRPSTQYCPKPLIPVGGVEPLFHSLYQLRELGVRDVVVNAHYLAEQIEEAVTRWAPLLPELNIVVSHEDPMILGTGGAIQKILHERPELCEDRGLLVLNGDTLAAFDLRPLLDDAEASSRFAVSLVAEHLTKYKPLWTDARGDWVGIGSSAPAENAAPAHFLGVHYLCRNDIARIARRLPKEIGEIDLFNGIYRPLVDQGSRLAAHVAMDRRESNDYTDSTFWFDMTNAEFLLEAQRFVLGRLSAGSWWSRVLKARYPGIEEREPGVWVEAKGDLQCRFLRPAVFVEDEQGSVVRRLGPLELGPNAAVIHERGLRSSTDPAAGALKIANSVVLISRRASDAVGAGPSQIKDEIRVL